MWLGPKSAKIQVSLIQKWCIPFDRSFDSEQKNYFTTFHENQYFENYRGFKIDNPGGKNSKKYHIKPLKSWINTIFTCLIKIMKKNQQNQGVQHHTNLLS